MKRKTLYALLLVPAVAVACEIMAAIVTPVIEVSWWDSTSEQLQAIGDKLDSWYGTAHADAQVLVRVPVRTCLLGFCGMSINTVIDKQCGETYKQAAYRLAEQSLVDNGNGGNDGGGGDLGDGGGYAGGPSPDPYGDCFEDTVRACVTVSDGPTNCAIVSELTCPAG